MKQKTYVTVLKVLAAVVLLFIAIFPIYWLVAMAIRPTSEMTGHISVIPATLTIGHFKELFVEKGFATALVNSLQTTLISLVFSMVFGLCTAYVIARKRFRFRIKRPLSYWVLLVRVLPPVAFTIPLYTMFSRLGILNTKIPATLACVLINVPFIIWFMISFFQDLPEEVEESIHAMAKSVSCSFASHLSSRIGAESYGVAFLDVLSGLRDISRHIGNIAIRANAFAK